MKHSTRICYALMLCTAALFAAACDDWTEAERVDTDITRPDTKDPAAWNAYTALVRTYKQSDHTLVYASLLNAPDASLSERDFLRSLPDSVDIVSLQRMPSAADLEDLPRMHELGTRVLVGLHAEDDPALAAQLIARHGFDGAALIADRPFDDVQTTLRTLGEQRLLVYEGDPSILDAAALAAFDLVVLPTAQLLYLSDMDMLYDDALHAGVPASKLLLSATPGAVLRDYRNAKQDAMTYCSQLTTSRSLAGIALYDISRDYYDPSLNYPRTRALIARLNLTPEK